MISILLPSRGRPDNVDRLTRSLVDTTVGEWEMIVRLDHDDPALYPFLPSNVSYLLGGRGVLAETWNECWREAKGDIFMLCGDDIVFQTEGWDEIVQAAFPPDGIAYVHGDDLGGKGDTLGTHGFLRREWADAVGYFTPPYFSSDYVDLWLTDVADMINRRVFVPIVTEHLHVGFGKAPMDETYSKPFGRQDDQPALYADTLAEREEWVGLLRQVMN